MKLNLGCGDKLKEGYINIDFYNDKADVRLDVKNPLPYENVDEVYTSHLIEHFTPNEFDCAISQWSDCLKGGGILELYCPDLWGCAKSFIENNGQGDWFCALFGEPDVPGQEHKNGFTQRSLMEILIKTGFDIIKSETIGLEIHIICKKNGYIY